MIQILSRRTKNNPCLIGEPGVGKNSRGRGTGPDDCVRQMCLKTIADKRVVTLDLSGMVAGSKYRGEFEEDVLKKVISEKWWNPAMCFCLLMKYTPSIGAGGAEGALGCIQYIKNRPGPEVRSAHWSHYHQ